MGSVTGFTAARSKAIEDKAVTSGSISGDNLILVTKDGTQINAGNVRGPKGDPGTPGSSGNLNNMTTHATALGLYFPEVEGAVGNGTTDDRAAVQAAVNACVAGGGGTVLFRSGKSYKLSAMVYINSDGTTTGGPVDRVKLDGVGAKILAQGLSCAFSLGRRSIDSNSQLNADGTVQISNRITVENLEIIGSGLRWYGCQRASGPRNIRIDMTGADSAQTTVAMFAVFCSTFLAIGARVDNGGDSIDAWILDTCSNTTIIGGSGSYCRRGLVVRAIYHANSDRSTSINTLGFHTEGNRRQNFDLQAVGAATIVPHIVTSDTWDWQNYPLISVGSDATSSAISVTIRGGYITGGGVAGNAGTAIRVDRSDACTIDSVRIANVGIGISRSVNATKFAYRKCNFGSVTTPMAADSGSPTSVLPGTMINGFSTQGGAALVANQTVTLSLGGINSANTTRVPVLRSGSVVGIGLRIGSTLTAGTLTVQVQKNGADVTGCSLVKGTGGSGTVSVQFEPGAFTFADSDDVRVQIVTSSGYAAGAAVSPVVVVEYLPGS